MVHPLSSVLGSGELFEHLAPAPSYEREQHGIWQGFLPGAAIFAQDVSYARCEPRCTFHMTGSVADRYDLWLQFPTPYPGKQPHPSEDLRHRRRQDYAVGDIMISTWTKLELEPSPLQGTHTPSNETVSLPAALVHRCVGGNRDGCHLLARSSLAFWRSSCHLLGMDQPLLQKVCCRHR
jgi:hypothetical protein